MYATFLPVHCRLANLKVTLYPCLSNIPVRHVLLLTFSFSRMLEVRYFVESIQVPFTSLKLLSHYIGNVIFYHVEVTT